MFAPLLGQTDSDIEQSDQRFGQDFGGFTTGRTLGVGPGHHALGQVRRFVALVFGQAKHLVDGPHRQALGHLLDEVTLLSLEQIIDDGLRLVLDLVLDLGNLAWGEDRADQPSQARVLRAVHTQAGLRGLEHLFGNGLERDALPGAEDLRVLADIADVLVARDHPHTVDLGLHHGAFHRAVPADGAFVAKDLECLLALVEALCPEILRRDVYWIERRAVDLWRYLSSHLLASM